MEEKNECTMNKVPKCWQDREKNRPHGRSCHFYVVQVTLLGRFFCHPCSLGLFAHMATLR